MQTAAKDFSAGLLDNGIDHLADDWQNDIRDKLGDIAEAIGSIATQLKYLGNGNAASGGWGAIEAMSVKIGESIESAGRSIAEAVSD